MRESASYENGKFMYLVSDVDNQEVLRNIILDTYEGLIKNR